MIRTLRLLALLISLCVISIFYKIGNASFIQEQSPFYVYLPIISRPCTVDPGWLQYVNQYRSSSGLPILCEDTLMSENARLHARYIVKNDELKHSEDPANPWYTAGGDSAARASNLAGGSFDATDNWAIDTWMQAPFHAVGILDPKLRTTGFGSYRERDGGIEMGAAINVISGINYEGEKVQFPILWPGNKSTVPIRLHWGEIPSPLTSCPGYQSPSGLPIIIQIGYGNETPSVSAHSFRSNTQLLDHCVFDETNYNYPDEAWQSTGRAILNSRDAIVIVPRLPLDRGETYFVSIMVNENRYEWSFNVSPNAP